MSRLSSGPGKRGASVAAALCAVCLLNAAAAQPPAVHGQPDAGAQKATAAGQTPGHQYHGSGPRNDDAANTELLKQVLTKKCLHRYTMTCLKLDLIRLIDRLGTARAYQLVPGVSLVRAADGGYNQTSATDTGTGYQQYGGGGGGGGGANGIPADVVKSLVRGNESADELDGYLMERVDAYLGSLSISVKLVDTAAVENMRKLSSQMLVRILPFDLLETGRGKKNGMNHAALWSAGTLAAIGFMSLAAMSGKALMTALLALVLAAVCALKGHGGGGTHGASHGKTSHYEIITKPAIYDNEHLVHGASYSSSAPYSYARHMQANDEGPYHVGGRGGPVASQPQHVSIVHASPAAGAGQPTGPGRPVAEDNDGVLTDGGQTPYPIAYIPTRVP